MGGTLVIEMCAASPAGKLLHRPDDRMLNMQWRWSANKGASGAGWPWGFGNSCHRARLESLARDQTEAAIVTVSRFNGRVWPFRLRSTMHISPHPLDFDWRFTQATVDAICSMLSDRRRVLALGAPTVALQLEHLGRQVTLIDRQPKLGVSGHIVADIDLLASPLPGYDVAIVDPPWYLDSFVHWATYAASCVDVGGTVLVSAWPASARPGAEQQLGDAIRKLSSWAAVRQLSLVPRYKLPRFERLAIEAGGRGPLSVSPRQGVLLELLVVCKPAQVAPRYLPQVWQRFVIDGYQLALRLGGPNTVCPCIIPHTEAYGWHWPYVSARAPRRSEIDLWSSDGEVALVLSSDKIATLTRARLALALLLYTGQRRGDVIRMGAQHIRGGAIHLTQEKTGAALAIPVHPALAAIIASSSRDHLTFLVTRFGAPFGASAFSHWFRDRCNEAGLPHCSAHGLRKAAARVLAEAGCTAHEIGAITGHSSLAELVRYTKAADQRRLAEAAMAKTRTFVRKPAARFAKKAGKAFEIKGQKR